MVTGPDVARLVVGADDEPEEEEPLEEAAAPFILTDDVAKAMALAYAEVSVGPTHGFAVRPLCGAWAAAHAGVAQDAWLAYAVHQD